MPTPARKPAPPAPPPPCERCGSAPRSGRIRFCKPCRKAVLAELERAGYLQPVPRLPRHRPPEAREELVEKRRKTGLWNLWPVPRRKRRKTVAARPAY